MKRVLWAAAVLFVIGMSGCAQVTESVNGAGRSIEGFFTPNR